MSFTQFPKHYPEMDCIADDPVFDPAVHLALELPDDVVTAEQFGYAKLQQDVPTQVLATSPFRVLSSEGVATLYHVCKQLEKFATSNARVPRNVRGGVYRSRFLRDLALSPEITLHVSTIMKTQLAPHGMPHQLAHLNYQPLTPDTNVDKWHWDTLQVDYVMFVTDPNAVQGGEFQYFSGTRDEFVQLRSDANTIPSERIIAPLFPGAGYAVLMQGDHVVHKAQGARNGERITLVNGYTYLDDRSHDYSALGQLLNADPEAVVTAEYARHMALRCQARLEHCVEQLDFVADSHTHTKRLKEARVELDQAIEQLDSLSREAMRHFGD